MTEDALKNRETALALAAAGFAVFPCEAGGEKVKQPMRFIKWREMSTTDTSQIRRWWEKWPTAAIGLDLAKSRFVVIDADRHGEDDGVQAIGELMAAHEFNPDSAPLVATPNAGNHHFFRQREGKQLGNRRGALPPGIDVRGAGGYVIAPGTIMADGRVYELWGDLAAAPEIPAWLIEIIEGDAPDNAAPEAPAPAPQAKPSAPSEPRPDDKRVDAYVQAAMDEELRRVRFAISGQRNSTLNQAAFSLGQFVGAGLLSRGTLETMLTKAAHDCGLKQPEIRKTITSGMESGQQKPRQIPKGQPEWNPEHAEAARILYEGMSDKLVDAETGEIVETYQPPALQFSEESELPPGLVGEIAQWILDSSRRPQRRLAVGAALTIVGMAAGRHIAGPTEAGTCLYVLGLSPTASGKDHPLKCISRILTAAVLTHHQGPSEFISMTAVINVLKRMPLCLAPMDEFGDFMRRVYARKGSPHERAIPKILRTIWSANFSPASTPEWAGIQSVTIEAPHLSLFGVSTHEQFYTALEGGAASDGTLNRFLIIDEPLRAVDREPELSANEVPEEIIRGIKRVMDRSGPFGASMRNDPKTNPATSNSLTRLGWQSEAVEKKWKAFVKDLDNKMFERPDEADFLARGAEMSIRIATIVAAGKHARSVEAEDIDFAIAIVQDSMAMMMAGARDYMADNEHHANALSIVRALKGNNGIMRHRILVKKMYRMRPRDLRDLLQMMKEAGQIEAIEIQPKRGPKAAGWRLVG